VFCLGVAPFVTLINVSSLGMGLEFNTMAIHRLLGRLLSARVLSIYFVTKFDLEILVLYLNSKLLDGFP
jgi:uncharacterized membrane protein